MVLGAFLPLVLVLLLSYSIDVIVYWIDLIVYCIGVIVNIWRGHRRGRRGPFDLEIPPPYEDFRVWPFTPAWHRFLVLLLTLPPALQRTLVLLVLLVVVLVVVLVLQRRL